MATNETARELLAKGFAGVTETTKPDQQVIEKKLSPVALLVQAYKEAYPVPKKAKVAVPVEITETNEK